MKTREEWLKERKNYLGGTDIAAICGVNPYMTALDVYLNKTSDVLETSANAAMERGNYFEPIVAELYAKRYEVQLSEAGTLYHPEYGFMGANIDKFVNDGEYILECKTAAFYKNMKQDWGLSGTDHIPLGYRAQIAWYAAIANKPKVDLAALFSTHDVWEQAVNNKITIKEVETLIEEGKMDFRVYHYNRDLETENKLIKVANNFWNQHIIPRIAPAPSDAEEEVAKLYNKGNGAEIKADNIVITKLKSLKELKTTEERIAEEIKNLQVDIKQFMKEHEVLTDIEGNCLVTWKNTAQRVMFDAKKFSEEYPDLHVQYLKTAKESRQFLLK